MEKYTVVPLSIEAKAGWNTEVRYDEKGRISYFSAKSQFGVLTYGLRQEGYDGWVFEEIGGGGSVTLPFFQKDGQLYVGLLTENRANMGGECLCIMGGFVNIDEDHKQTQIREAEEESGLKTGIAMALDGLPMNSNRAFFVADPRKNKGIHAYVFQIEGSVVQKKHDHYILEEKGLGFHPKAKNLIFLPWQEAIIKSADVIAVAVIGRLVAKLGQKN